MADFWAAPCPASIMGLVIVPVTFLGADQAWQTGQRWTEVMLLPAMGFGDNHARDEELLGTWSTHNQAFVQVLHKTIHIQSDPRPEQISRWVQLTGLSLGVILTVLTLLAYGTRASGKPIDDVLCLCALCVNMLSLSPAGIHITCCCWFPWSWPCWPDHGNAMRRYCRGRGCLSACCLDRLPQRRR
jgi:hypothetical protein